MEHGVDVEVVEVVRTPSFSCLDGGVVESKAGAVGEAVFLHTFVGTSAGWRRHWGRLIVTSK